MSLVTAMFTWQGADGRGLESARVLLGKSGLRALGRMVRAPGDGPAFTASYRLFTDEQGELARLSVTSACAERERNLTLNHTEDGYWLLDDGSGSGSSRAEFDGALDIDLEFSPLFNALPIRRLESHRRSVDETLPVVFVALPSLEVRLVSQRYRTISTLNAGDRAVVEFSSGDFAAELAVDADGLVLNYPGLATRL